MVTTFIKTDYHDLITTYPKIKDCIINWTSKRVEIDESKLTANQLTKLTAWINKRGYDLT